MLKIKGNYLAAVSGGPDSMALLHVYKNNIKYVCHVNYHFRKDSDNDELLVKQACKKLNIKLYIKSIDSKIYQSNKIDNFEAWAREIRYNFFAQVAKKTKLNKILIGHHADDFLETALMQKNKSSHTLFYGIKQFNTLKNLNITRPFIDVRKKILINYCHKNNIKYCLDYTNNDPRFARNKIRKEIIKLNDTRFNLEINKFKEINNRNKNFINLVEKTSIQWIKSNHSIKFFKNIKNKKLQQELIYLLLINESPKRISMNKIDGIISFIISDKTKKMYRVNAGFFLYKTKNNILYLKQ